MPNTPKFAIVCGASAGGLNALCEFVAQFQKDIDAAIFIVLHLSNRGIGEYLAHRLQRYTELPCHVATDDLLVLRGNIYVAPPDAHLIVKQGYCVLGNGVEENRWRPSIDVLFRSAAIVYREYTIGVILTGLLNDGTAGMITIKKCGGMAMVQDPNEAEYPEMPLAVLDHLTVDYSLPLGQMGAVIYHHISNAQEKGITIPQEVIAEAKIAEQVATGIEKVKEVGTRSVYACPDCGGGLWEINEDGFRRYRCHIGHAYSEADILKKQSQSIDAALWISVRMMEERRHLLKKISREEQGKGLTLLAKEHRRRAEDLEQYINTLKSILFSEKKDIV